MIYGFKWSSLSFLLYYFKHSLGRKKNTASSPMVGCRSHSHVSAATGTSTCPRAGQWNRLTATSGSTSTSAWGLMVKSSPVPSPLVLSLSIITLGWTSRRFLSEYDVKNSTQKYLKFSENWQSLALLDPWLIAPKTPLFDMYLKEIITS